MAFTVRLSQMEPEFRELNSGSEMDAFLCGIEQAGAQFLPDIRMERVGELEPLDNSEENPLQVYWHELSQVPSMPPNREAELLRTRSAFVFLQAVGVGLHHFAALQKQQPGFPARQLGNERFCLVKHFPKAGHGLGRVTRRNPISTLASL